MIAGLPLYDLPELEEATDALWRALARALGDEGVSRAPAHLTRGRETHELWSDPALAFSQICGYPLQRSFHDRLQVVATPRYTAPGCEGATYRSLLCAPVAGRRRGLADLAGARCAVNEISSHSGMNALRREVAPFARRGRFFAEVVATGSHRRSLELLAAGGADVAAIDCVTFALLRRVAPELTGAVCVLGMTAAAPAPPYVISRGGPLRAGPALAALRRVLADPILEPARRALLLDGVEVLPPGAYLHFQAVEDEAARQGYPALA